jgi:AcrR family transcriptional regulator
MRVLADVGFRRATVELTASYAGLPQATVYARFPSKPQLFRAAVLRDVFAVLDGAFDAATAEHCFDGAVTTAFSGTVWALREHPLVSEEPTADACGVLDAVAESVAARLRASAVATGRILDDPAALGDTFTRLAHALLFVPDPSQPMTSRANVDAYARRHLAPLAGAMTTAAPTPAPAPRVSLRYRSFQLIPAVALTLLLGSGALAAALVKPWSAPVRPTDVNETSVVQTTSNAVATTPARADESDSASAQTSPPVPPSVPVAPVIETTSHPTVVPSVSVHEPVDLGLPGNNRPRTTVSQGPPSSAPSAPAPHRRPFSSPGGPDGPGGPGSPGGSDGPGSRTGSHEGGPP